MKIIHRISLRATAKQRRELEFLGIQVPEGVSLLDDGDKFISFEVNEGHANWSILQELFRKWDAIDVVSTQFSKKEIAAARWLNLTPDWHCGYPQPDELAFGYREATYDTSEYCPVCGVGLKQKAPFQMRGEPKWGRRSILQLNWVYDEYFVTPEAWKSVFYSFDVGCQPVTDPMGNVLRTVVQLDIKETAGVVTDELAIEHCSTCNRVKYLPVVRGPFPSLTKDPSAAMARTKEYFGSGASAYNGILLNQSLAMAMADAGIKGASVRPVALL